MTKFNIRAAAIAFVSAAALSGAAHAGPVTVKVADINTLSPAGAQAYDARVGVAATKFCNGLRASGARLSEVRECLAGVRVEMTEKLQARNVELAKRNSATTFAEK